MRDPEKLIFEMGSPGRIGYSLPPCDVPELPEPLLTSEEYRRKSALNLPEVSEVDVVRHFTRLSQLNYGVDCGFYPLGSCTMKYNPKVNETAARLPGFSRLHPYQPEETVQGALRLMYELGSMLSEITGMAAFSLQPAAGAHGEMTGLMIIKAYHAHRHDNKRRQILVPDSAHGTNPASAAMLGYEVVEVKSNERGTVDLDTLKSLLGDETAGLMLTNPNTLGLFEDEIVPIAEAVHGAGGLVYYDGANLNAVLGVSRPGDMGFDVVHLNLHKTFSSPHGGGGPGAGPVGVCKRLMPFLPKPVVALEDGRYRLDYDRPLSVGKVRSYFGNFGVLVRAYAYILSMGSSGLREAAENAVLNANYLLKRLKKHYHVPFDRPCMHECVVSCSDLKEECGISALDVAKRLIDYGFYPPTIYFPLVVKEALMIEPTETEGKETLDAFAEAMIAIVKEAKATPELFGDAPHDTVVSRLDEVAAARNPILCFKP